MASISPRSAQPSASHAGFQARDGIELPPFLEKLGRHVVGGIVRGVARHAEGLAFQQIGAIAGAHVFASARPVAACTASTSLPSTISAGMS